MIDNPTLLNFWKDKTTKDAVYAYLVEYLKQEAVVELFEDEESDFTAYQIAEAKRVVDKAFTNLDDIFEPKPKVTGTNSSR